ncbi:HD domain-containing phosphohydrolase [Chitiniphilus eburneus]|uniref:GAF domain-containing protein n=1 Tax=Chitiniphilus eburneus TaxID=2571148 RepID=A0A4U0Q1F4_9NEIS|nr:HD domain-containing phosphohydrolase [Chitiniphilus eburneus]TJZ74831.1 GAF domain-containing protein [Chitiniphilus eburneus]
MPPALQNVRYPLHIHIAWLFLALIVTFSSISIIYHDRQASRMILADSRVLFSRIGEQTEQRVSALYGGSGTVVRLLARHDFARATTLEQRLQSLPYLTQALASQPAQSAIYAGNDQGDFFLLRRYDPATMDDRFKAPPQTGFVVQSVERGSGTVRGRYLFFDAALRRLGERDEAQYLFDPRQRPWYAAALRMDDVAATAPYVFFTTREVGTTLARRTPDGRAVVAVDITLDALSDALARDKVTPGAALALIDAESQVVAYGDPTKVVRRNPDGGFSLSQVGGLGVPVLAQLASARPGTQRLTAAGRSWQGYVGLLPVSGGANLRLVLAAPEDELLADARRLRRQTMLIAVALAAVMVPLAILLSRLASRPIVALTDEAREIQALRFASPLKVRSFVSEIDELAQSMGGMKSTIHQFLHIGSALASEHNFERLLARILRETVGLAGAEGGVVYLREPDGRLTPAHARWHDRTLETSLPVLAPDEDHPVAQAVRDGHSVHVTHGLANLAEWYGPLADFEAAMTLIAIPLTDRHGVAVGVLLLLEDDRDGQGIKRKVGRELVALVEAVSGSAAAALQTQRLLAEQKALLEAFIQLVAGAIDAKSPYTGGHCQRVPVLTKMLAEAGVRADHGPLRDFTLNEEQWEALHIAAWLHDCGKVTTPEYVVDKATKLETLYDRIHEVRMRFELLKRDAELNYWRAVAGGADDAALRPALDAELAALDDDFAFVAACNEGGEAMAPENVDRLRAIAARTWRRTLSDRIGISHEERQRKAATPEPALPVYEPLLADRPEHLFARGPRDHLPEGHGFDMAVPEHLYNRGELYNLSVRRGTLTAEERYKINEHIVQTIVMLEKLPFPRHLMQVPELAGGHHEKMDGTGYPRRLTRAQMSIPARMMAIADIFEALTAIDRPYKEGKKLSEAVAIMARMAREAHVDPDLFRLFIESGVYRDYAVAYLQPGQIDEVDETAALAGVGEGLNGG